MRRREFITLLGGAAAAWPLAARAQQQQRSVPEVGFLYRDSNAAARALNFRRGLAELGYVEGRNVAVEYRSADAQASRLPQLAADLVRRRPSVIVAPGGLATVLAAKSATATIPIVFEIGSDLVEDGLVASFNRPGGNLTGITAMNGELMAKRFGILSEALPRASRIGVLLDPDGATGANPQVQVDLQKAAAALGRQLEVFFANTSPAVDDVFANLIHYRIDALLVGPGPVYNGLRVQLATAAARHLLPTMFAERRHPLAGGLMSYGTDDDDVMRQVGVYTGLILKGEKPANLPVLRPTRFEFVINLQTARLLRIEIPPTLLAIADTVIE